ncbi:MAG TPA: efflux RND transporter periplasmic adaptor subunit [Balneolaceae bacterium]|nr:efflux RND transporter periplasmic adaptor subunit [Balneolaceae bacterium]
MRNLKPVIFLAAILMLSACSGEEEAGSSDSNIVIPSVEAVQARFGSLPLQQRLSGIVQAQKQVDIYPRISAPVEEVYKQDGDQVEQGEPLLKLRDREYVARVEQAEASLRINRARVKQAESVLKEAESLLRRQQQLYDQDLISDIELESAQAEKQSAEANYELAVAQVDQSISTLTEQQELLDQTVIRSPITGTVGQRNADPGMQISSATRVFTVGDLNDARITVSLTEQMLGYIKTGQRTVISSENMTGQVVEGEVSRISPFLGMGSFSTEAEIDVENIRDLLLPGMFVTVDVMYGESEQATLIPLSAIYRHPRTGETGVYIAPDYGAETEPVEQVDGANPPPLSQPTMVEFVGIDVVAQGRETAGVVGVQGGDWIVTVGQNLLINNESGSAKIRATSWNRIMRMQQMKPQDLLRDIMNQRMAERAVTNTSTES